MKVYDIISKDNRSTQNYYTKIGTFPLQPQEKNNYDFPLNNVNIILDVYWNGNSGNSQYAKFSIAMRDSNRLLISTLKTIVKGNIIDNPIAYVKTENGFDLYVRANTGVSAYLNVKCNVISSKECRFVEESGNGFIDISNLNPTYYQPDLLNVVNCNITNLSNANRYYGTSGDSSNVIAIPNYQSNKRYIVKIKNFNGSTLKAVDVFIYNGNMTYKFPYDDTTLVPTFSDGNITLSSVVYYSQIYYEIVMF